MLKKLVLVRHGDAEFFGPEGTDESRRLTRWGLRALERAYPQTFAALKQEPKLSIWVSPAVRTAQTAEVIGRVVGIDSDEFDEHLSLYEQDDEEFLAELYAEGDGCVVAVGHVPFMYRFLGELTGEDMPFDKGSAACIGFDSDDLLKGKLLWFVDGPKA